MRSSLHDGILFVEGRPGNCRTIRAIRIEIGGILLVQSQLKTLKDVKDEMARQAKQAGGNAIVDFQYGQRSVGWLRSIFQLDDISWYGTGAITQLRSLFDCPYS